MSSEAKVLTSVRNHTGVIELNRPKALNALDAEMIGIIDTALQEWKDDSRVQQVLVMSNSEKAFCAGGDVRDARQLLADGNGEQVDSYFRNEYRFNGFLADFPKPYITVIDGVVMGGGLGISLHGSHRVVTEKAFAAMPEMAIGYFTDVGVAYAAQRAVGTRGVASPELAKFWGLTGYRMYAADLLWTGIATHFVPSAQLSEFTEAVIHDGVDAAVREFGEHPASAAPLEEFAPAIEDAFAHATWPEIESAVQEHTELAQHVAQLTAAACPTSLHAATRLFEFEAGCPDVHAALEKETELSKVMVRRPDFSEGVRAVLVDKTKDANFAPADAEVAEVAAR